MNEEKTKFDFKTLNLTTDGEIDQVLQRIASRHDIKCSEYKLNKLEQLRYDTFYLKHSKCKEAISVTFIPTGIGCCVKVKCLDCGEEEDITDVSDW